MEEFIRNIIPGNYFITKSMEFTRETVSGTLWYLKKYLVLYYNIFLNDGVSTEEGIRNIIEIFEKFIESLPEESKEDATKFFFPEEVDLRSNYNKFNHFKGNVMFANRAEENAYISTVKQYYFVYLMQIGGQAGVKRHIREHLYRNDFSMEKLEDIINEYLSTHPEIRYDVNQIKNDYHAALRNERQILWYYGFVHSKSTGSSDTEFSSLTPVGEVAIKANYEEFKIIWEHQKIKMISQPVTVQFSKIENNPYADGEKFELNYSPYLTILSCLYNKLRISKEEYQFIISRTNETNKQSVMENIEQLVNQIANIKQQVQQFNRKGDIETEDFDKELKKYMIGIRDDIAKDYNKNLFGVCSFENRNGIILNKQETLEKILSVYNQIDKYKIKKYVELFKHCEQELRKKYTFQSNNENYSVNPRVKIRWDLYNIHIDKVIIIALILTNYILEKEINIEDINLRSEEIRTIKDRYKRLLESCNITKIKDLNSIIKIVSTAVANNELEEVSFEEEAYEYSYINEYTNLNATDLKEKIERVSRENVSLTEGRVRSTKLINLMRALYNSIYSDENKLIKCECCGNVTFLTPRDEAFLEYHHLLPFSIVDGPDHYINIYGICADCHSRLHHAKEDIKEQLYSHFDENNHLRKTILERFKFLRNERILKSYQLEYALAEHIINEDQYNEILA